jgi:ankyrin repeat protein
MPTSLPERPDLDQLRHQAKDLHRAARAADPRAFDRFGTYLPLRPGTAVSLSAAQWVIAREYGQPSWPALVAEVQARNRSLVEQLRDLVSVSVRGHFDAPGVRRGWQERAVRLLAANPDVTGYDIRVAAVVGDAPQVARMLAGDPGAAQRPDDQAGWPPLLFVCNSRWHQIDPGRSAGLVEVARLLLDAGADPNTAVGRSPLAGHCSALYAAAGLANHYALAALLLDRGADPDTPSALYHTAFHPDHACLRLLLEHGSRDEGTYTLGAAISVGDTEAVRLLLAAGVDPRVPIPEDAFAEADDQAPPIPPVRAAIQWRGDPEMIELLLAHGADPDDGRRSPDGPSTYQLAARRGAPAIVDLLRRHGAHDDATTVDEFLGACARGDRAAAQTLLQADPGLMSRLPTQEFAVLVDAADYVGVEAVAVMLDLGFPVDARRSDDGATALHTAAYTGRADVVRLLIAAGADIEALDTAFDGTPLSWATVGSGGAPRHAGDGDWVATVEALLDAGARTDDVWIAAKPPSSEVAAVLFARGIHAADEPTDAS